MWGPGTRFCLVDMIWTNVNSSMSKCQEMPSGASCALVFCCYQKFKSEPFDFFFQFSFIWFDSRSHFTCSHIALNWTKFHPSSYTVCTNANHTLWCMVNFPTLWRWGYQYTTSNYFAMWKSLVGKWVGLGKVMRWYGQCWEQRLQSKGIAQDSEGNRNPIAVRKNQLSLILCLGPHTTCSLPIAVKEGS